MACIHWSSASLMASCIELKIIKTENSLLLLDFHSQQFIDLSSVSHGRRENYYYFDCGDMDKPNQIYHLLIVVEILFVSIE